MRATIAAVGQLRTEDLTPRAREVLLGAFRNWKRAGAPPPAAVVPPPPPGGSLILEQLLLRDVTRDARRDADHELARRNVLGHEGTRGDECLGADLDSGQ